MVGLTTPLDIDSLAMLNTHGRVAVMPTTPRPIPVSPQVFTMLPSEPASPTSSEADSECADDGSSSSCSFIGEECPDLCGGPKHSCRSWTPPASPFYYIDKGGMFLLDDRQKFDERQKIELEHTLHDLDERLHRLKASMSPPRFLNRPDELEDSTPVPPNGKAHEPSERSLPSPTECFAEHSRITKLSPQRHPCDCDVTLRRPALCPTRTAFADSSHNAMDAQGKGEFRTMDLGKLIHTSLQHVQATNSPPKYLTNVSGIEAQLLRGGKHTITSSHPGLPDRTLSTKHASPQTHLGNTAYPTPLPSSPETKPSRKRGPGEGSQESSGWKKRRGEEGERISMLWRLRNG